MTALGRTCPAVESRAGAKLRAPLAPSVPLDLWSACRLLRRPPHGLGEPVTPDTRRAALTPQRSVDGKPSAEPGWSRMI